MSTRPIRELYIEGRDALPDDVRTALDQIVSDAVAESRTKHPPGDGSMVLLMDHSVRGGQYDHGFSLQASFLQDARFYPMPYVSVYVYPPIENRPEKHDWIAVVQVEVDYSSEERRALDVETLAALRRERAEVDRQIVKLEKRLEGR